MRKPPHWSIIYPYMTTDGKTWIPSPAQARVLLEARKVGYGQSIPKIAARAEVPWRTVYNWLGSSAGSDPEFRKVWCNQWKDVLDKAFPSVVLAMVEKARKGSESAARFVGELSGQYIPKGGEVPGDTSPIEDIIRDSYKPDEPPVEKPKEVEAPKPADATPPAPPIADAS